MMTYDDWKTRAPGVDPSDMVDCPKCGSVGCALCGGRGWMYLDEFESWEEYSLGNLDPE